MGDDDRSSLISRMILTIARHRFCNVIICYRYVYRFERSCNVSMSSTRIALSRDSRLKLISCETRQTQPRIAPPHVSLLNHCIKLSYTIQSSCRVCDVSKLRLRAQLVAR